MKSTKLRIIADPGVSVGELLAARAVCCDMWKEYECAALDISLLSKFAIEFNSILSIRSEPNMDKPGPLLEVDQETMCLMLSHAKGENS